jgi:nucleotide-binding universal stress UspA family protein
LLARFPGGQVKCGRPRQCNSNRDSELHTWNANAQSAEEIGLLNVTNIPVAGAKAASGFAARPATRRKRRSYEPGHKPKFLVVLDDTPECDRAVYFASRRARRVDAEVLMLYVIDPLYLNQEWLSVAEVMRAEAHQQAQGLLEKYRSRAAQIGGLSSSLIREGDKALEILKLIEEDDDIAMLVLAAGSTPEGPGPLVSDLARTAGTYPIPVVIVPEHLTDQEIDALS